MRVHVSVPKVKTSQVPSVPAARSARRTPGSTPRHGAYDLSRIAIDAPVYQPRLKVGAADHPLEHEADLVAEQVLRMPAPGTAPVPAPALAPPAIRRACACTAGEADEHDAIRRKRSDSDDDEIDGKLIGPPPDLTSDLEQRVKNLGGGTPLPSAERVFFEPRFGRDFSNVLVHADPGAAALAGELNARAFTFGPRIVFGTGEFAPGGATGRPLLAHELTHVVQQRQAPDTTVRRDLATPAPEPAPEAEPDLTPAQISAAIRFNRFTYDEVRTRQLQDLIGTDPTGTWTEQDILAVAALQEQYGLRKDGMVGPETFGFLDRETRAEALVKTDENCLLAFNVNLGNAVADPVVAGERALTRHFTMRAQFSPYCGCGDYQYRQFIRGHKRRTRGGVVTDLGAQFGHLPAGRITDDFREDGKTDDHVAVNYGHRAEGNQGLFNGYFNDPKGEDENQATGCHFLAFDDPTTTFHHVMPGDTLDALVAFHGDILRRGRVVQQQFWTAIDNRFVVP